MKRIYAYTLCMLFAFSFVFAHSEDPTLTHDHPVNETQETGNPQDKFFGARDFARDWMFTGFGFVLGIFVSYVAITMWKHRRSKQ